MDTFVLNAITQELQQQIRLAKINHIAQPDEYVILTLAARSGIAPGDLDRRAVSISVSHPTACAQSGLQFRQISPASYQKYRNCAIQKPLLERMITFDLVKKDIDGQDLRFSLILEIMGRYSNLILINQDTNKILDSLAARYRCSEFVPTHRS